MIDVPDDDVTMLAPGTAGKSVIEADVEMEAPDAVKVRRGKTKEAARDEDVEMGDASAAAGNGQGKGKGKGKGNGKGKGKGKGKAKGRVTSAETVEEEDEDEEESGAEAGTEGGQGRLDTGTSGRKQPVPVKDEGEDESGEEYHAPSAAVETLDGLCGRALFTYARINLFKPPLEIEFGEWNRRPEVESQARDLAKSIVEQKFRPFASDSLLPLIINETAIDPASIHTTPNIEDAPMLTLTAQALQSGMTLKFGGGRHRRRAAQIIIETCEEKVKKFVDEIDDLQKRVDKAKEGSTAAEALAKKIRLKEMQIVMERDVKEKMKIWGVAVYREGE